MCKNFLVMCWILIYLLVTLVHQTGNKTKNTMTTQEFNQVAKEKFSKLSISELKKAAISLNDDFSNAADLMMNAVMDLLMERMPEQEFIKFCNEL